MFRPKKNRDYRKRRVLRMENLDSRHLMTTWVYQETPDMTADEVRLLEEINDFRANSRIDDHQSRRYRNL